MTIDKFDGEYGFLSNFYLCTVHHDGLVYPSAEHAYQAAKFDCFKVREQIRISKTPGQAKRMGQKYHLRPNWDTIKPNIMFEIVLIKFAQNSEIREKLIKTYPDKLIERNTWGDTYWGVCNGEGQNMLGRILMMIRKLFLNIK